MALRLLKLQKVSQPVKNVPYQSFSFDDRWRYVAENIVRQIKQTPELLSMIDTAIIDHFMGPVDFHDGNGKVLGSTRQKQVENFWQEKNVQWGAFYGQAFDYFMDGNGFGWHVEPNTLLSPKQRESLQKFRELTAGVDQVIKETSNMPLKMSYLAASTTEIIHDEFGIIKYKQSVGNREVEWSTDQVVHIPIMPFNGEIRSFSGIKALAKEIAIMRMLKENIIAKLANGGSPDNIISIMRSAGINRARYSRLEKALESFSHLKKSHGNMPIDAEVKVHSLGTALKDMEYQELAMFCISEFALILKMPSSRTPFLMTGSGGSSNKGELSGNSEDAYQTGINARRMQWESSWNGIFRKANFTFRFRRDNIQDDVRETQAATQRTAYVAGVQGVLQTAGKKLHPDILLELVSGTRKNLSMEDVQDIPKEEQEMNQGFSSGKFEQNRGQPDKQQLGGRVANDNSQAKKKTASNNFKN